MTVIRLLNKDQKFCIARAVSPDFHIVFSGGAETKKT